MGYTSDMGMRDRQDRLSAGANYSVHGEPTLRSVELFAGAGGLAMGVSQAGFNHELVVEYNRDTCTTIRSNQALGIEPMKHWPLREADVSTVDYATIKHGIDLLSGGPPCQPF